VVGIIVGILRVHPPLETVSVSRHDRLAAADARRAQALVAIEELVAFDRERRRQDMLRRVGRWLYLSIDS